MSFGAAFDAKEQVRQAIDIVDLVGSYIQLRRQGRNFVGLCPWHDDSRPSMQVNPDRQSFKCWVCDYGGDIFSFIMRAENIEFREALELLAERAGIQLRTPSHSDSEPGGPPPRPEDDKRTLYRVLAWAEEQFHHCLLTAPEAEPGRVYLAERGLSADTIRRFRLGFAPDRWDWLLLRARESQWSPSILERVGLLRRKELGGGHYDWFRGRVMFSIRDARSRPIAFGGRVLPQLAGDRVAKYINSPDTPVFCKGGRMSTDGRRVERQAEFYGLDIARQDIAKRGQALVFEGYTDVLMAHQFGITNAIAVLGTALGEVHVPTIRRYCDRITLVLDGDEAGKRRTNEILDNLLALFEKFSIDLRILTLPEGIDPCDFIVEHGSEKFRELIGQAVDALEHKFNAVTNGLDTLVDTHRASQAAEQLLGTLAQIRPVGGSASSETLLREEQMLGRIARKFHLQEEMLRSRLVAIRQAARSRPSTQRPSSESAPSGDQSPARAVVPTRLADLPTWDRGLLELLLLDPSYTTRLQETIQSEVISSPTARAIFVACCRLAEQGDSQDFGRLLAEFDDPAMKNLLVALDESAATKANADRDRWLADLFETYRRRAEETQRRAVLAAARQSDASAEQLLAQFCEQTKSKHRSEYERRKK